MKRLLRPVLLGLCLLIALASANFFFKSAAQATRPVEFDLRGPMGVPKGTALHAPTLAQLKSLTALQSRIGDTVQVRYNGLTGTPRFMFSYSTYLSPQSSSQPEAVARDFVSRNREMFRFSDEDLSNLKLKSRAYVPDIGTTIMLFEQRANSLPVYHGEVLVNVNRLGHNRLTVSWRPAASANPSANLVYDIYRAGSVAAGDGTQDPAFTPLTTNRIAAGVSGTSYTDAGLALGHVYYYIVQARDLSNGKKDSNNTGNTTVKFSAPTSNAVTPTPVFAIENFEGPSPNTRFVPPLVDSGNTPNQALAAFQHVSGIQVNGGSTSMMYAPDFSPSEGTPDPVGTGHGGPSDFSTVIGPLTLTSTSLMEFDHLFKAEFSFDGGVIEVA